MPPPIENVLILHEMDYFGILLTTSSTKLRIKDEGVLEMAKEVFQLSRAERKKIEKRRGQEQDRRIYQRLSVLLALDDGHSQEEVARLFGAQSRTVRRWIKTYRKSGLDGLCTITYPGRQCFLTEEQLESLKQQIEEGNFRSAKQARKWIEEKCGAKYSLSAVKNLLRQLGATYHRTTPFLFKADPEKQKNFTPLPATETQRQLDAALFPGWHASGLGR